MSPYLHSRLVGLTALASLALPGVAKAGPNAGGTLILHSNESIVYCQDDTGYCSRSGISRC